MHAIRPMRVYRALHDVRLHCIQDFAVHLKRGLLSPAINDINAKILGPQPVVWTQSFRFIIPSECGDDFVTDRPDYTRSRTPDHLSMNSYRGPSRQRI